jgi:PAS domain S-box-containing protein
VLQRTADLTRTNEELQAEVAERKRAEQSLRPMIETIPEMIWSAAPDGMVDYCNQRILDYTGLPFDQMCGEGWAKVIHSDDLGAMAELWRFSVVNGVPYQFEFRGRRTDAMFRWCVSNAVPLRDEDGQIVKWYGTIVDLHDWKQAQEALQKTQAELAHAARVATMGELTSSIAHEINQPLGAIANNANACSRLLAAGAGKSARGGRGPVRYCRRGGPCERYYPASSSACEKSPTGNGTGAGQGCGRR